MKSEFAFIALPVSALIAPSAFAVRYLTVDQAQQAIFPGKSFTAAPVKLTSVQRKAIEQAGGVRVLHDEQQVWRVSGGGWFIVDEVVFFFKQKTAYEIGLGIPAEPLFRSLDTPIKFMRASIKMIGVSNLQSFIASMTQKLTLSDISDESKNYLDKAGITTACLRIKSKWTAGGK